MSTEQLRNVLQDMMGYTSTDQSTREEMMEDLESAIDNGFVSREDVEAYLA